MKDIALLFIVLLFGPGHMQGESLKDFASLKEARETLPKILTQKVRNYSTFDFGREKDARNLSILVRAEEQNALLQLLRNYAKRPMLVFIGTTQWLGDENNDNLVEIVIGEGASQFDIVRLARSDAVNYDMMTEELIKKLRAYDSSYGIDIFHAETDTIEFRLRKRPANMKAFAEDLYEFCPDIVDQGTGTIEALIDDISKTNTVFLWWD